MPDFAVNSLLALVATFVALAFALLTIESVAVRRSLADSSEVKTPGVRGRLSRRRLVATAAIGAAVLLGLSSAAFTIAYYPLRAVGPVTASGTAYLGTVPGTFRSADDVVFETVSGGEMTLEFGLVNTGQFPLTVQGLRDPVAPQGNVQNDWFRSFELVPAAAGGASTGGFEIQPGATVRVVARFQLNDCAGWAAMPRLGPGQSPSARNALAVIGSLGTDRWQSLPIVYDALGLSRESDLALPVGLVLETIDPVACSSYPIGPLPSGGPQPTPVPPITFP